MTTTLDSHLSKIIELGLYPGSNKKRLKFYAENQLFNGISLSGKRVVDIGGGSGLFSFISAAKGAEEVVCLEPEHAGSTAGVVNLFNTTKKKCGFSDKVRIETKRFQDLEPGSTDFDIGLLHNSINHLDEGACIRLNAECDAQAIYEGISKDLFKIIKPGGLLIICDCSSENFFNDVHIKNPFAGNIEWHKHQPPRVWRLLLEDAGFHFQSLDWTCLNFMGNFGKKIFNNKNMAYLLTSHFRLVFYKD